MAMNTAKTLQLLDANNNNISPAVCIDSVYFEQQNGNNTYRMSLRNRMIVASSNVALNNTPQISNNDLSTLQIPYYTIDYISGTGNNVYALSSELYNIGKTLNSAVEKYIKNTCYTKEQADDTFLNTSTAGTNNMKRSFYVQNGNTTNSSMLISYNGLSWNNGNNGIKCSNDIINITSDKFNVNTSSTIKLVTDDGASITINREDISKNCLTYTLDATRVENNISESVYTNTSTYNINTSIFAVHTDNSSIFHTINGSVYIYDTLFDNPYNDTTDPASGRQLLTIVENTSGTYSMNWVRLPNLVFYDLTASEIYKCDFTNTNTDDISIYVKSLYQLQTNDSSKYDIILKEGESANNIYVKYISSGTNNISLLTNNNTDASVRLSTINGQSLLSNVDLSLATTNDVSAHVAITYLTAQQNSTYYVIGATDSSIQNINNKNADSMNYTRTAYFRNTGALYATSFYASSDERLKTDINTVYTSDLPEVKNFKWIDTSANSYGFIAQEWEAAGYGDIVDEDENGLKKLDYNAALCLKVAQLETENKKLSAEVKELREIVLKIFNGEMQK